MTIDLGMPQPAREPLAPRRKSRQIMVGKGKHAVPVGGGAPVSVQSMATTLTADVNATLQQIAELTATRSGTSMPSRPAVTWSARV